MTGPRVTRALEIVDEIEAALLAAGVEGVLVTIDALKVPAAARLKAGGAVVVNPPRLEFPTYHHTTATWTIVVVSGPADNVPVAWDRLDEIVAAIAPNLDVMVAEPDSFQPPTGPAMPAYKLTFTD